MTVHSFLVFSKTEDMSLYRKLVISLKNTHQRRINHFRNSLVNPAQLDCYASRLPLALLIILNKLQTSTYQLQRNR